MVIGLHSGNWSINVSQKVKEVQDTAQGRQQNVRLAILRKLINVLILKGSDSRIKVDMFYNGKMEVQYDCRSISID
jgi:hypothetical protein